MPRRTYKDRNARKRQRSEETTETVVSSKFYGQRSLRQLGRDRRRRDIAVHATLSKIAEQI